MTLLRSAHRAFSISFDGIREALAGVATPLALAPRTRRKAGKSGIWSWLGIGTAVAVVIGVVSLRVAQDHGSHRPSLTAARAAPKKPLRR